MKNILTKTNFRFLGLACLFCVLLVSAGFSLEARVVSVLGKAEVQEKNTWKPLKAGDVITAGRVISTGFKSQAVLAIGKSTITLKPLSRLTLEQLSETDSSDDSKVYLNVGSIKADVKAAENKRVGFTVKGPVATASVRGTAGEIDSEGNLESTSGVWAVLPANAGAGDKAVFVSKGSGSAIRVVSGRVVPPQEVNSQRYKKENALTRLLGEREFGGSGPSVSTSDDTGYTVNMATIKLLVAFED